MANRTYRTDAFVKLPEPLGNDDVWELAAAMEAVMNREAAAWDSPGCGVWVHVEKDGMISADNLAEAQAEVTSTDSTVEYVSFTVGARSAVDHRGMTVWITPHGEFRKLSMCATGPVESETIGKAEVLRQRGERWVARRTPETADTSSVQPASPLAHNPSTTSELEAPPAAGAGPDPTNLNRVTEDRAGESPSAISARAVATAAAEPEQTKKSSSWDRFEKIGQNKMVLLIVAFVLAGLAAALGFEIIPIS